MKLNLILVAVFTNIIFLFAALPENIQEFDVAIIGGGAAGVSQAYYLKKENPQLKIAIFEKESCIGGKCYSYIDEQGQAYDMGAIEEAANYTVMKELIDIAGVNRIQRPELQINNLSQFGICQRFKALFQYIRLCRNHKVQEEWNFSACHEDSVRMMTLDKLIDNYHLDPLKEIFDIAFKNYGYGELNQILAGTAFSYLDEKVMISSIVYKYSILKFLLGRIFPAPVVFLKEGFQKVFQNLVARMEKEPKPLQVFLNTTVTAVNSVEGGVNVVAQEKRWRSKIAVITSGWQHIEMPSINSKVRQLFKNITYENYGTTVLKLPAPMAYECMINNVPTGLNPLVYVTKFTEESSRKLVIAYTKGDSTQGVEIFSSIKSYLGNSGIEVKEATQLAQRQVEYYPRFTFKDISNGAYRIIEENQGVGNIFFGGAILNFELTEAVAAHSKRMAPIGAKFLKEKDCSIVDELTGDSFK